jgi:serine protease Do
MFSYKIIVLILFICSLKYNAQPAEKIIIKTPSEKSTVFINGEELGTGKRVAAMLTNKEIKSVQIVTPGYRTIDDVIVLNDSIRDLTKTILLERKKESEKYIVIKQITGGLPDDKSYYNLRDVYSPKNKNSVDEKVAADLKQYGDRMKVFFDRKYMDKYITTNEKTFSKQVNRALLRDGYIDTLNQLMPNDKNTLILEGKINSFGLHIVFFRLSRVITGPEPLIQTVNLGITWYVKNVFNETLDSIKQESLSENFIVANQQEKKFEIAGNAIELCYYKLKSDTTFIRHLKHTIDLKIKEPLLVLKKPEKIVSDKTNAFDASLIVKTDNGHGSGFAISNDGYLLTNFHVVSQQFLDKKGIIEVITSTGEKFTAELIRANRYEDLALLKINHNFSSCFEITNNKDYKAGDKAFTIGTPKSIELGQSVSGGVISATRSINGTSLIQLNMSVNSGNSGGPVFNEKGKLNGVIISKLIGSNVEGVAFAIPGNQIEEFLNIQFQ